jgi:uncharacterized pyridoxal phosphate-containing UPF0001 family protein
MDHPLDNFPIKALEEILYYIESHQYKINKLVVVTKTHSYHLIQLLYDYGHRDFGENRYQEAKEKLIHVKVKPDFPLIAHHIGPLQSGNARHIPEIFEWVHGVGSIHALAKLAKAAKKKFELTKKKNLLFDPVKFNPRRNKIRRNVSRRIRRNYQYKTRKFDSTRRIRMERFYDYGTIE